MSITYIVSGHLGGIFLAKGNPDDIEAICEQCGDSDHIETEYEDGNVDDAIRALISVYTYYSWIDTDIYPDDTDEDIESKREWIIDAYNEHDMLEWANDLEGYLYNEITCKYDKVRLPDGTAERFAAQGPKLAAKVCAELDKNVREAKKGN